MSTEPQHSSGRPNNTAPDIGSVSNLTSTTVDSGIVQSGISKDEQEKTEASPLERTNNTDIEVETGSPSSSSSTENDDNSAPGTGRSKLENVVVMMALSTTLFLAALDSTIVATAVPTITSYFNSSTGYVWIGSAYLLGSAAFVPTWREISDIFGRKPIILLAVTVFLLGSVLCGVSKSLSMLIAGRVIQGIGSGGCIVLPNLCVTDLFSQRDRGMYFGLLGLVWSLASALGPVIGGVFTDKVSWQWCFYINLPVGGVALLILVFFLKLHNPRTPIRKGLAAIDWVGNVLIIGATLMLLLGLEFGGVHYPWKSATVISLLVFSAITVCLFAIYESRFAKFPVIPLELFRDKSNIAAYSLAVFHGVVFVGANYWLPLYFQSVLTATPLLSGVYLLPFVLSSSVFSVFAGILIKKTGNYKVQIRGGFFISILGYGLFTYWGDRPHWDRIILFQIVAGLGVSPNFQAPLIALQTNVEQRHISVATASFSFLRGISNSLTVTVGGTVFNNVMQGQNKMLAAAVGSEIAAMFSGDTAAANAGKIRGLPAEDRQVVKSAYWIALRAMFILYTGTCFVGFVASLFVKQKVLSKQHTEHKTGLASIAKKASHKQAADDNEKNVTR